MKHNSQSTEPIRIPGCPICHSPMKLYGGADGWPILKCSHCPLDYGRSWYTDSEKLLSTWKEVRNNATV